jgi:hypothetical protein
VAIRHEEFYIGMTHMSLDGLEMWLDLILKLIKMKIDGCIIKKIFLNEMEVKVSDQIPHTSLGSIITVCLLNEFGIFFFLKNIFHIIYFFFF